MKWTHYLFATVAIFGLCTGQAQAADELRLDTANMNFYPSLYDHSTIELAANATGAGSDATMGYQSEFEESAFTLNKMHGYVGVLSLVSALAAGATAPENDNPAAAGQPAQKGFHHYAAISAAALGGAAVMSGLLLHADDLTPDFLDPDTAHMILGILGTAAYVLAVSKGPKVYGSNSKGTHAAAGMAGAGLMATAIYLEF